MPLLNLETSIRAPSFLAYHGAVYQCGTLWKRARAKSRVHSGVHVRTLYMPPLHGQGAAVGETPRCESAPYNSLHTVDLHSVDSGCALPTSSREGTQHGDTFRTGDRVEMKISGTTTDA